MSAGLVTAAYIIAALFFILSLAGLSNQESARRGNVFGIAGMAIALIASIFSENTGGVAWILIAMILGAAIGIHRAKKVENKIEHVYREALANMFKDTEDLKGVVKAMKMREVYRHLSNAADRSDEAANVLADIVVKTS